MLIDQEGGRVRRLRPPHWRAAPAAAWTAGFRVVVADHRAAYLTAERFPQARRLVLARPDDEIAEMPAGGQTPWV